jgi:hypothetical protein
MCIRPNYLIHPERPIPPLGPEWNWGIHQQRHQFIPNRQGNSSMDHLLKVQSPKIPFPNGKYVHRTQSS